MKIALLAPPDSLAPGLAGALGVLGPSVVELPFTGDLRSGVDVAGCDVLVTVAPRPALVPLAAIEPADWRQAIRDTAERPAAAARAPPAGPPARRRAAPRRHNRRCRNACRRPRRTAAC